MSGSERKCIGVLIAKPDRDYQHGILCGIYKAAFENDMSVAVFSSTVNGGTQETIESELEIFTLPNYDKLSGVIYVPMTFDFIQTDEAVSQPLLRAVRESGLPAVTIDGRVEDLPCVLCDDTETIRTALEHLITEHGCKDIAYMTGPEDNPHARARLGIFRDTMKAHGLEILSDRTYYGDFWVNEGDNFVEMLLNSKNGLPDAAVCANSYMACSVYKALRRRGIRVPEDIMLADYSDETNLFDFITGSQKEANAAGYTACKTLVGMINGTPPASPVEKVVCGSRLKKSVSCGCIAAADYDFSKLSGMDISDGEGYFGEFNPISTDLLSRPSYIEMFYGVSWYTYFIKDMKGIYFCLCDGWNDPAASAGDEVPKKYTDRMNIYFSRVNNADGTHKSVYGGKESFELSEMFPRMFDPEIPPASYIFRPLHFSDRNFGYVVLDNGDRLRTFETVYDYWLKDVSNAMESQRRLQNMKYLYNSDLMTGTYNRNGFYQVMPELLSHACNEKLQFFIAVGDLNGMKYINDTFGHNEGDVAIKTAAEVMCALKLDGAVDERNFRIGGDEFVKAAVGKFTDEEVADFKRSVERMTAQFNETSGKPYPVYISVGTCVKNYGDEYTVDSMMHEADEEMFRKKAEIRERTGFFPKRK